MILLVYLSDSLHIFNQFYDEIQKSFDFSIKKYGQTCILLLFIIKYLLMTLLNE